MIRMRFRHKKMIEKAAAKDGFARKKRGGIGSESVYLVG